jgi:hypothetical protein
VQVVMGLLIDNNGIPIDYELFSGNTMDQNTLRESVGRLRALYGLGEITVVADRGMNSSDNLLFLTGNGVPLRHKYTLKVAAVPSSGRPSGRRRPLGRSSGTTRQDGGIGVRQWCSAPKGGGEGRADEEEYSS